MSTAPRESLRLRRHRLQALWSQCVQDGVLGSGTPAQLRAEVADSWRRSLALVNPAQDSAPTADSDDAGHRWRHSALREPVLAVADELRSITDEAGFIAAVTDEAGTILWTCGSRVMQRRAGAVNFAPGGRWDEAAMGTNALSLALHNGVAASVFSAEHLVHALHGWVCYCTPLHGPDGSVLGVLDLSSTWDRSHPLAMPAVRTLAAGIEARLAARGPEPGNGGAGWRLRCLGEPALTLNGMAVPLRPRQLEILALLTLEGRALTPESVREALYGERQVTATTLKAEVSHLRRALRGGLATRRYELTEPVACDAVDVLTALRAGRVDEALDAYGGPLLPGSDAPGIAEWREHIEVALREAVLRAGRPEPALRHGELHPDDLQIQERAVALLGSDPRRGVALARLHRAARDA